MCGHHDISLATSDWSISSSPQDKTETRDWSVSGMLCSDWSVLPVCHHSNEAVNVSSEVNLDEVSIGEDGVWLTEEGRVVADDVVHGDAGRKGNSYTESNR